VEFSVYPVYLVYGQLVALLRKETRNFRHPLHLSPPCSDDSYLEGDPYTRCTRYTDVGTVVTGAEQRQRQSNTGTLAIRQQRRLPAFSSTYAQPSMGWLRLEKSLK